MSAKSEVVTSGSRNCHSLTLSTQELNYLIPLISIEVCWGLSWPHEYQMSATNDLKRLVHFHVVMVNKFSTFFPTWSNDKEHSTIKALEGITLLGNLPSWTSFGWAAHLTEQLHKKVTWWICQWGENVVMGDQNIPTKYQNTLWVNLQMKHLGPFVCMGVTTYFLIYQGWQSRCEEEEGIKWSVTLFLFI